MFKDPLDITHSPADMEQPVLVIWLLISKEHLLKSYGRLFNSPFQYTVSVHEHLSWNTIEISILLKR